MTNGKYQWQVKVWDQAGKSSAWSAPASFQMGLMSPADWKARWIESGITEAPSRPSQLFRKSFSTARKIKSATAYITSHGMYEAYLNGKRMGDAWLTPGWTSYNKRLQYQSYDVTHLLQQGANTVGAMLGNGWYRSVLGWQNNGNIYGKTLGLLMQINIEYTDGSKEVVATDGSWKSETGAITYSEIYNGETIDARKEKLNWNTNNYDDNSWTAVQVKDYPLTNIVTTVNEPVKSRSHLKRLK
ncbi:alpha-L-rhamnosidase N-terminal domain-containing protein [Niabella sp. W65]|nr:alpha-L-rhamnosidase N-terminal domain-containing protein [Niabella sp. W65]MCH7369598.1 alpha-L-rhamnosidase N-terminal domain-containing protein [Niabella sp. W65]